MTVLDADQPRFPDIRVPLSGYSASREAILGRTAAALAREGLDTTEFWDDAEWVSETDLIRFCMKWVTVT